MASSAVVRVEVAERRPVSTADAAKLLKVFMKEHGGRREGPGSTNVAEAAEQPVSVSPLARAGLCACLQRQHPAPRSHRNHPYHSP